MADALEPKDGRSDDALADFDDLFEADQPAAGKAAAPEKEEDLDELEAFLEEFEKNLDADAAASFGTAPAAQAAPPAEADLADDLLELDALDQTAVELTPDALLDESQDELPELAPELEEPAAEAESFAAEADFASPEHAEELVHGLLKEDDFDLDVEEAGSVAQPVPELTELDEVTSSAEAPEAALAEVEEFEPELPPPPPPVEPAPPTPPAYIQAAPAPAAPATESGAGRLGLIAAALGGLGLLGALGAGWLAMGSGSELAALRAELRTVQQQPVQVAADPRLETALRDLEQLKLRLAAVSASIEGPLAQVAEGYPHEMESVHARLDELAANLDGLGTNLDELKKRQASVTAAPPKPAAAPQTGGWVVNLSSFTDRKAAERELAKVRSRGIEARIAQAEMGGRIWYRLAVTGFASADAARAYVAKEAKKAGYAKAWIGTL